MPSPGIVIVREGRLQPAELARLVSLYFEDMVKYVVDVSRGVLAVGGEMHADAQQVLLINIRPAHGNRSMEIQDPALRERVLDLTRALLGEGEPLP
jgi:hypothetical protein